MTDEPKIRFTEADVADIGMAEEMWAASPAGREHYRRLLDSLPSVSFTLTGYFCTGTGCTCPTCLERP